MVYVAQFSPANIPPDFYNYVLPFLFVLAVGYYVLGHVVKAKEHQSARALLAIVLAFLVMPAGPTIGPFLAKMGTALAVLITLGLVMLVFMSALGHEATVFTQHTKYFAPIAVVLGFVIFVAAGGLSLLGISAAFSIDTSLLVMIAIVVVAVWILGMKPDGGGGK